MIRLSKLTTVCCWLAGVVGGGADPSTSVSGIFSYQTKHPITCHLKTGIFINAPVIIYQYLENYALAKNDIP